MGGSDAIGTRGEAIFAYDITNFFGNERPYFRPIFLGEKHESLDFLVVLLGVSTGSPFFFVQVKTTRLGYTKDRRRPKLRVKVSGEDVERIKRYPAPSYFVGVDEPRSRSFIVAADKDLTGGFSSLSTANPLDASTQRRLWEEVRNHWDRHGVRTWDSEFKN